MQAVDIAYLDIDVAVGGIDQRKIHMLSRENIPKLGFKAPICIHMPLLIGLDGEKMSSSLGNYIAVDEPAKSIEKKIMSAFCPAKIAEGNPILQIYKHTIFPAVGEVTTANSYEELELDYLHERVHPLDVKTNAVRYLNEVLAPMMDLK